MGKRSRNKRRAEGLKSNETKQERYERVLRERQEHWNAAEREVFQPTRDDLQAAAPQRPRPYKLAGFVARMRRNNGGA